MKNLGKKLYKAVDKNRFVLSKFLIWKGADVNFVWEGCPLLCYACAKQNMKMIKLLVRKGADVNAFSIERGTALHESAFWGNYKAVSFLLENGARVDIENSDGDLPLHKISGKDQSKIAEILIGKDPTTVNWQNKLGETPLHVAVFWGQVELVKTLLKAGAKKDVKDENGKTPRELKTVANGEEIKKELNRLLKTEK